MSIFKPPKQPKPKPIIVDRPQDTTLADTAADESASALQRRRRRGFRATIATSPQGVLQGGTVLRQSLG